MLEKNIIIASSKKRMYKAPPRFELGISCLLDRRFNQLSHGAKLLGGTQLFMHTQQLSIGNQVTRMKKSSKKKLVAQRGARTHDPEIKSLMLYRLS